MAGGELRRLQRNRYVRDDLWSELWPESRHRIEVDAAVGEMRGGSGATSHDSAGVVWEKAKMRAEHFGAWERCALVTDIEWIDRIVGLLHWMMPGSLKLFPVAELAAAKTWAAG